MREIKFRVWDAENKIFLNPIDCTQLVIRPLSGKVTDGATTPNVELLQYTGLKDRNGVEIYEWDILEDDGEYWEVQFFEGAFWVVALQGTAVAELLSENDYMDIIGNRYENPELLEDSHANETGNR